MSKEKNQNKNFLLGILNGTIFKLAVSFYNPNTVLPLFISFFTSSKLLIGSITTITNFGFLAPQLFVANLIGHWERKKSFYTLGAFFRITSWFAIFIITYIYALKNPLLVLISFFFFYSIACLGAGISQISFLDIVSKVVKPTRRGKFFSLRQFFGGILGIGGGIIVKYIFSDEKNFPFPLNFSFLFFLASIFIFIALFLFICVKEPPSSIKNNRRIPFIRYLKNISHILSEDKNYRLFLITRLLLSSGIIALPFYIIYARDAFHIPKEMAGIFISSQALGGIISTFFWGYLSDKYGNKIVVQLSGIIGLIVPLLTLISGITMSLFSSLSISIIYYSFVFLFLGMNISGNFIGQINLLLEISSEESRPTYIGIVNTLSALVMLLPLLGGVLIEKTSYLVNFSLAFFLIFTGLIFTFYLEEPRKNLTKEDKLLKFYRNE